MLRYITASMAGVAPANYRPGGGLYPYPAAKETFGAKQKGYHCTVSQFDAAGARVAGRCCAGWTANSAGHCRTVEKDL